MAEYLVYRAIHWMRSMTVRNMLRRCKGGARVALSVDVSDSITLVESTTPFIPILSVSIHDDVVALDAVLKFVINPLLVSVSDAIALAERLRASAGRTYFTMENGNLVFYVAGGEALKISANGKWSGVLHDANGQVVEVKDGIVLDRE